MIQRNELEEPRIWPPLRGFSPALRARSSFQASRPSRLPSCLAPLLEPFFGVRNWTNADYDQTLRPNAAVARYSIPIAWQPGDIAILENIAWTHARPPYELADGEARLIGVLISEPVERRRIVTVRQGPDVG